MAAGGKNKDARVARERTRAYQARQKLHEEQVRRRRRDNLVAGIGGGILILAILGGQVAFFTAGPGRPAPTTSPAPSVSPTAASTAPALSPSPSATPTP